MIGKVYGVDLGTSLIKIYKKGKGIVVSQRNIIAIENNKYVLAVGDEAYEMYEKAPESVNVTLNELMRIKGIGRVKAIQILCVVELTKRMSKVVSNKGIYFNTPQSIADYFMQEMRHLDTEQVTLVLLNSKNRLIKEIRLSKGTVNASLTTPREVFIYALKYEAVNFAMIHNHPSGDPTPSQEDIRLTSRIKESSKIVGINLIDHIIIGDNIYTSLGEMGLM